MRDKTGYKADAKEERDQRKREKNIFGMGGP